MGTTAEHCIILVKNMINKCTAPVLWICRTLYPTRAPQYRNWKHEFRDLAVLIIFLLSDWHHDDGAYQSYPSRLLLVLAPLLFCKCLSCCRSAEEFGDAPQWFDPVLWPRIRLWRCHNARTVATAAATRLPLCASPMSDIRYQVRVLYSCVVVCFVI